MTTSQMQKIDIYADKQVRMMIEDEHHNVVGIVDIINFDPKNMRAEVGIVIKQDYRNKGYALANYNKNKTLTPQTSYTCISFMRA